MRLGVDLRKRKTARVELVTVLDASALLAFVHRRWEVAIRYGCFFSYAQGRYSYMSGFATSLADALRCYLEPYFDDEDELFVDREQLGGGDDIDHKIARAMCESVAMIMIYTPKYEVHPYTRREFAAMQLLEAERSAWYPMPSHLIIPVIMTHHPDRLPPQITNSMYVDFSRYTMATNDLKLNADYIPEIQKIATRIALHYERQKNHTPASHNCNHFVLPAVPPAWRDKPEVSFPKI
jgi:hypothetical protein